MTLDDARAHIGNPVMAVDPGTRRPSDAEIIAVDDTKRLVELRVRYRNPAQGWRPGTQWWAPCHLGIPNWWTRRQEMNR